MRALPREILDIEVKRRRVVGQLDELAGTQMGRRLAEQVHERDAREHAAVARRTGRHGCGVQSVTQRQQAAGFRLVEDDLRTVVVEERECVVAHRRRP